MKVNSCNNCIYAVFSEGMCGKTYFNLYNPDNDCKYFEIRKDVALKLCKQDLINVLKKLREYELEDEGIDWDEYETGCREQDYTRTLTLIQETLDKYDKESK